MKPLYLIAFFLFAFATSSHAQSPAQTDDFDKTFTKAEVMPDYPGGDKAWIAYLNKNLHFPMDASPMQYDPRCMQIATGESVTWEGAAGTTRC